MVVALVIMINVMDRLLQLKEDFEFSMPFLGRMVSTTMDIMMSAIPSEF